MSVRAAEKRPWKMKKESELKSAAMRALARRCPTFLIFQVATAGWPDRGIAGNGRITFWEFKHSTPHFDSPANQVLACMRLAEQAHCRYVIWAENKLGSETRIVHPMRVHDKTFIPDACATGFDHEWLARQIEIAHGMTEADLG